MQKKDKILETAIEVFNDKGYHAVTLTDVAHACEMSRGNLAYHFKYKKHILNDLIVRMVNQVRHIQLGRKDYPAFINLSLDVKTCGILQDKYKFIFRDSSVLEHNSVKRVMKIWSEISIKRNLEAFAFGIEVGTMKPEPFDGLYHQLSVNAWMVAYYWVAQQSVRSVGSHEEAEKIVWSTVVPHFTEKGLAAFQKRYGADYFDHGGIPVTAYQKEIQLF